MTLLERITGEMKDAMKAKNETTLYTLRLLKSALKNKQIDLMHELSDEEVMAVVKTQIKQLKDGLDSFEKAGRTDLADGNKREIGVLEAYLPAQMDDASLAQIVKSAVAASGASSKADAGKAMGAAMKAVAGRADGTRVKRLVETLLPVALFVCVGIVAHAGAVHAAGPGTLFVEPGLKLARVFLMLMGIVSVNFMLIGGFSYMVSCGRDDVQHHAETQFFSGFLGTLLIAALFMMSTIILQRIV